MNLGVSEEAVEFGIELSERIAAILPQEWCDLVVGSDISQEEFFKIQRAWGVRLCSENALGPKLPRAYGGMELDQDEEFLYATVLANTGAPEPANASTIENFGMTLVQFGTDEQRRRFLPPMLSHQEIWCQGFSEPNAGSDLAAIATKGRKDREAFRVEGQKVWTSRAQFADFCYALIRTGSADNRHDGLTMMIIDMRQDAVTVRPLKQMTEISEFCEVFFDGATVESGNVVGGVGNGWDVATYTLSQERSTRLAIRSVHLVAKFEQLAGIFGDRNGDRSRRFGERMVDGYIDNLLLQSLVKRNIALGNAPAKLGPSASMGKVTWSEAAQRQSELGLELLGECSASPEYRSWLFGLLDSRAMSIYGGTSEIQRNLIAQAAGLARVR